MHTKWYSYKSYQGNRFSCARVRDAYVIFLFHSLLFIYISVFLNVTIYLRLTHSSYPNISNGVGCLVLHLSKDIFTTLRICKDNNKHHHRVRDNATLIAQNLILIETKWNDDLCYVTMTWHWYINAIETNVRKPKRTYLFIDARWKMAKYGLTVSCKSSGIYGLEYMERARGITYGKTPECTDKCGIQIYQRSCMQ